MGLVLSVLSRLMTRVMKLMWRWSGREDETSVKLLMPLSGDECRELKPSFMKYLAGSFMRSIVDSEAIEDKECMVCAPTRVWNIDDYKRQLKAGLHNTFPTSADPTVLSDRRHGLHTNSGRNRYIRVLFDYCRQMLAYCQSPSEMDTESVLYNTLRKCNVRFVMKEAILLNWQLMGWLLYQHKHPEPNARQRTQKEPNIAHLMDHRLSKIMDRAYKESPLTVTDGSIWDINRYKRNLRAGSPTHFPCIHLAPFEGEYRELNSAKGRRRYLYMLYRYSIQLQRYCGETLDTGEVCECCRGKGVDKHHVSLLDTFNACPRDRLETENDRLATLVIYWLINWHNNPN